jgi:translation initiation factor eIF-2B subunit alpha/methylthioribose-1-phosphate isomerase
MLPKKIEIIQARTLDEQVEAIKTLAVRGAPAIGSFGAFSLSFSLKRGEDLEDSCEALLGSRPTAVDLRNCLDEVRTAYLDNGIEAAGSKALEIFDRIIEACKKIGEHGASMIPDKARIMTHCNAGAVATMDWGTALSPMRIKKRHGGEPFVWVSETRPLLQGARLTAWELSQEGIDHKVIVDSASGYVMRKGEVDLVITGADRVCANGDIANKIGTYEKAVIAHELEIPFYVAFPRTTIDPMCPNGDSIPIEERGADEVGSFSKQRVIPAGSDSYNPAFDVTPSKYISAYITEDGIFSLQEFMELYIKKAPL